MLKRLLLLALVTFTFGATLTACDAPDIEDAEVEVDD